MGIRYDSDSRRPTNGPMIFFSDPSSEGAFSEEIRGAIISGLSFYSYHLPGATMLSFGSSESFVEGIGMPGYVIGMFDPSKPVITIPYGCTPQKNVTQDLYGMPEKSTTEAEYKKEVEEIQELIHSGKLDKAVAARVLVRDEATDLGEMFFSLMKRFPEAYIFCFSTPSTGCWIGASPELLLESTSGILSTMALAGTREASSTEPWDNKNIVEQEIVRDYILNALKDYGLDPREDKTFTKIIGNISHLCTPIHAPLPSSNLDIAALLKRLSPTPALCGFPKDEALRFISQHENFSRGCYGGFCGPYHSSADFTFNVVLRCASVAEKRLCIYAGGGITVASDPLQEWQETETKILNTFPLS